MSDPWRPMTTKAFSKLLYDTSAGCSQPLAVAEHRILREEYEKLDARLHDAEAALGAARMRAKRITTRNATGRPRP